MDRFVPSFGLGMLAVYADTWAGQGVVMLEGIGHVRDSRSHRLPLVRKAERVRLKMHEVLIACAPARETT
jgi:hypothetical protein